MDKEDYHSDQCMMPIDNNRHEDNFFIFVYFKVKQEN